MNTELQSNSQINQNQNLPKKRGRFFKWLFIFLIIIALFGLYYKYQNSSVAKYFGLPSFQKQLLISAESLNTIKEETIEIKSILNEYKNNVGSIDTKIEILNSNIIDSLKKIEQKERANILVVASLFRLINSLNGTKNFSDILDTLLTLSVNPNLQKILVDLKPYSNNISRTYMDLKLDYYKVYQNIYLDYLSQQTSFLSKLKYCFLTLIFIENRNILKLKPDNIEYKLQEIKVLLNQNPELALQQTKDLIIEYKINDTFVNNWIKDLEIRVNFLKSIDEINNNINMQYLSK
jgi:hypothetical protein